MRSPGNADAFWAKKNCTVAAQTRTRMERFIFFASSLYKFRLHLHHPYSSSFAKNLHFPTPHPCPLLEPAFARLRRGRRRGEVPKCQPGADLPRGMLQGGSAPNAFGGDAKFLAAFGCVVLTSSDGALDPPTSSSPRDQSVRRRTRDCSIHHNKLHSLLVGSEDELSRAPLQLTCVVDDQR